MVRIPDRAAQQALNTLEAERRRLASDLHDTAAQALAVVRLSLEGAIRIGGDGAVERVVETLPVIDQAIAQVRELIFCLRPPLLDELGLAAALRWNLGHVTRATGMITTVRIDPGAEDLAPETELACYRIAQEAIANAVRHSEGRSVSVRLVRAQRQLRLEVADDGHGMPTSPIEFDEGQPTLGVRGMAERAAALGGSLRIISRPGRGTRVIAILPIPPAAGS